MLALLAVVIPWVYTQFELSPLGATGKRYAEIVIVGFDGSKPSALKLLARWTLKWWPIIWIDFCLVWRYSSWGVQLTLMDIWYLLHIDPEFIAIIAALWLLSDFVLLVLPEHRSLHDRLTNTMVAERQ